MTITLDSRVPDVLKGCPPTGEIFIQYGRFSRHERGSLYLIYEPELSVGAFAARAKIDPGRLLRLLQAATESCDTTRQMRHAGRLVTHGPRGLPAHTIGYTGSHREARAEIDVRPVVEVQAAQGPD
jgi:hypothetical protein